MTDTNTNTNTDTILNMPDITSRILTILSVYSGIDIDSITCESGPNTPISSLDFDSLEMVEVVQELEKEFSIDISDSDIERLVTVGELVEYVARKVNEQKIAEYKATNAEIVRGFDDGEL